MSYDTMLSNLVLYQVAEEDVVHITLPDDSEANFPRYLIHYVEFDLSNKLYNIPQELEEFGIAAYIDGYGWVDMDMKLIAPERGSDMEAHIKETRNIARVVRGIYELPFEDYTKKEEEL